MIGDRALAIRFLDATRKTDLANFHLGVALWIPFGDKNDPRQWPEYIQLQRQAAARVADLRRRY
jgi:hypothetical protein